MYKFRIILDAEEDVIREIAIAKDFSLEELHQTIVNAFSLDGKEMASFYFTNEDWNQLEEVPLFNMNDSQTFNDNGFTQMKDYKIDFIFTDNNKNMLYVYDFLNLWTFYVELISEYTNKVTDASTPLLILSVGELPKEAPKKEFEANKEDGFDDEFDDEFNDNIDDYNFDDDDSNYY